MNEHENDTLGRAAYDAYCDTRGWKSFRGDTLPEWTEAQPDIKHGWILAAKAAIRKHTEIFD